MKETLEIDLSDIKGKTTQVNSLQQKVESPPQSVAEPIKNSTGYVIAIPTDYPMKFFMKDIADCTGQEFLQFAKFCFPKTDATSDMFESVRSRVQAFQHIQTYHTSRMTRESLVSRN